MVSFLLTQHPKNKSVPWRIIRNSVDLIALPFPFILPATTCVANKGQLDTNSHISHKNANRFSSFQEHPGSYLLQRHMSRKPLKSGGLSADSLHLCDAGTREIVFRKIQKSTAMKYQGIQLHPSAPIYTPSQEFPRRITRAPDSL